MINDKVFEFPCNKCNGKVVAEIYKDDWGFLHKGKIHCLKCGREFFGYSFNKTEEGLVYNFSWDKWKDKEGDE